MKPKKVLVIFSFLILQLAFSIRLTAADTWTKTYNPFCEEYVPGNGWIELEVDYVVEDVLVTQDGGYVVSGSFDRWIDDDPPFWFDHWGFLMKTDCDGNLLWAKGDSVDFLGETDNYAFVETEDGDLISVGYCYWGGGYMIKRDSEGNRLWEIPYDDFGANSMCKTNDGNIILGGVVESEIALRKLDNNGNTIWTKSYDCGYTSIAQSITQTSDNGFALTGLASGNGYDIIVMKTDSLGDSLWTRTFDGYGYYDQGNCIIENNNGDILIGGLLENPNGIGFLWLLNPFGDTIWTELLDNNFGYQPYSIVNLQDDSFAACCTHLYKFDYDYNIVWISEYGGGGGDKCLSKLINGYFIFTGISAQQTIKLVKTNENGEVPIDDYKIISFVTDLSCYPNPFNNAAIISFDLVKPEIVNLSIYNIKGEKIKSIIKKELRIGVQNIIWNGKDMYNNSVSSGVYIIRLKTQKNEIVKKIIKIGGK